jgi:hypothetical protein
MAATRFPCHFKYFAMSGVLWGAAVELPKRAHEQ